MAPHLADVACVVHVASRPLHSFYVLTYSFFGFSSLLLPDFLLVNARLSTLTTFIMPHSNVVCCLLTTTDSCLVLPIVTYVISLLYNRSPSNCRCFPPAPRFDHGASASSVCSTSLRHSPRVVWVMWLCERKHFFLKHTFVLVFRFISIGSPKF